MAGGAGRLFLIFVFVALASCAHRDAVQPSAFVPFDQQLANFAELQNAGQFEQLRGHFAANAIVQSPVTTRPVSADVFLAKAAEKRFRWVFTSTEVLYSTRQSASTRSRAQFTAPGGGTLAETVLVDWKFEDGFWRISRIEFPDWQPVLGEWKRSGVRGEDDMFLSVFPGGTFVLYVGRDHSLPALRGRYTVSGNMITFIDQFSGDTDRFGKGTGTYGYSISGPSMTLRAIGEDGNWRSQNFPGIWRLYR